MKVTPAHPVAIVDIPWGTDGSLRLQAPGLVAGRELCRGPLRIDPHHRNTLEYSGELYLMKGELPKAQALMSNAKKIIVERMKK